MLGTFGEDILKWISSNPDDLVRTLSMLSNDYPQLSKDDIMELAIQDAFLSSVDETTPAGTVRWDVDPETGERSVTRAFTPEIQQLFEGLIGQAGAGIDVYQKPSNMDAMLGKYMNDRNKHMGLPEEDYEPYEYKTGGLDFDFGGGSTTDDSSPPPTSGGIIRGDEGGGEGNSLNPDQSGREDYGAGDRQRDLIRDLISHFPEAEPYFDVETGDYTFPGQPPPWLLMLAPWLGVAGRVGSYFSGIPGLGSAGKWAGEQIQDWQTRYNDWQTTMDEKWGWTATTGFEGPGDEKGYPFGSGVGVYGDPDRALMAQQFIDGLTGVLSPQVLEQIRQAIMAGADPRDAYNQVTGESLGNRHPGWTGNAQDNPGGIYGRQGMGISPDWGSGGAGGWLSERNTGRGNSMIQDAIASLVETGMSEVDARALIAKWWGQGEVGVDEE
jgi:hypothetical protein